MNTSYALVLFDISIQKKTEKQLTDKLVEMKNKDLLASDLLQIFLKNMSRIEINTPIWTPLFHGLRSILNNMLGLFLKAHSHRINSDSRFRSASLPTDYAERYPNWWLPDRSIERIITRTVGGTYT